MASRGDQAHRHSRCLDYLDVDPEHKWPDLDFLREDTHVISATFCIDKLDFDTGNRTEGPDPWPLEFTGEPVLGACAGACA